MHILQPITSVQEIKIKPRKTVVSGSCIVELISKSERRGLEYTVIHSHDSSTNITTLSYAFPSLIAESYYTLTVKDNNGVFYRGMVYITEQTNANKYEVGKGDYIIEDTFDNSFIVIGGEGGGSTPVPSDVTLCYDTAEMDALTSAFKICDLYCVTIDEVNYDDWYLPSRDEAVVLYERMPILNDALTEYGYDPYYVPEIESTPSGPVQTNRAYWSSTEVSSFPQNAIVYQQWFYISPILSLTKDIAEDCYLSGENCNGSYEKYYKTRVRPVRFEPNVGDGDRWQKGYGGVIAGQYTLNGVQGALIVSPTEPKGEYDYTQWSDLGQTQTNAVSETDGQANTAAVLALGG